MGWKLFLSVSAFLLLATAVGVSEGLRCYKCGTFLATTSVSPCLNLTNGHLLECPLAFCSKYVGLSSTVIVYGCESNCQQVRHGAFDAYCCADEDGCNGASHVTHQTVFLTILVTWWWRVLN